jgi:hypothetical protein
MVFLLVKTSAQALGLLDSILTPQYIATKVPELGQKWNTYFRTGGLLLDRF